MDIEWNNDKLTRNLQQHGVDFAAVEGFRWEIALTREDTRIEYNEARFVSISLIGDRHYVAVWTMRGTTCRIISLRKANKREVAIYVTR